MSEASNPRKKPEPIEKVWLSVPDYARLLRIEEAARQRHYEFEPSHRDVPPRWCPLCAALATEPTDA